LLHWRTEDGARRNLEFDFEAGINPITEFFTENPALLREPTRRERLEAETELFADAAWECAQFLDGL
jgi:hypothetical protein